MLLVGALAGCAPTDPLESARELQVNGRFEDSLAPLRQLIASRPDDPEVHYRYGLALLRTGQPGIALWALRKASEHPDWVLLAGPLLGAGAMQNGNWSTAIEAAERMLAADPDNFSALVLRANARLFQKSDPEAVLADYNRALELEPDNTALLAARAAALLSLSRVDEAGADIAELEERAREASVDEGTLGHLCVTRATFLSERQAQGEAEARFVDCLASFPTHRTVVSEAMRFFDERGTPERANGILTAALERVPQAVGHRALLAGRLRSAGQFDASERVLRVGLELDDSAAVAGAWAALADHYVALEDLDAAAAAYERSLALTPEPTSKQILTFADVLARARQNERALEVAGRLTNPAYRGLVEARVHLNRGEPAAALEALDTVLPIWPDNPGARYYAARAAEQQGDFDRAIEEYRQAIRSGPEFTDAGFRLAQLHQAEGAGEPAWIAMNHHYQTHPDDLEALASLLRLAHRFGPQSRLRTLVARQRRSGHWGAMIAVHADELALRNGSEAAVAMLRREPGVDFANPAHAPALRALCVHLLASGRAAEASEAVEAALAAHPQEAAFHEIHGRVLEGRTPPSPAARSAYQRAVELDPHNARALEALGRLRAQGGDVEGALALYERAAAADPLNPSPLRRAAALAVELEGGPAAEARWEALLDEHPWDAEAALALARLRLARGADADAIRGLAQRAARFGASEEAERVLARAEGRTREAEPVE